MPELDRRGERRTLRALMMAAAACVSIASASAFAQDATTAPAPEERVGNKMSFNAGVDFTSHFISFGGDVWHGGNTPWPFSARSTTFAHATVTSKFTDELSGFVNLWSDLNDNTDSGIGGPIQEIDFNAGLNYTMGDFTFGATYAYWQFGGGAEKAIEASVSYNDAKLWENTLKGFALNPSFLAHYRYDVTGDLVEDNACVLQASLSPSYTIDTGNADYPVTLGVPMTVGYFTDPYQGGDGAGFGYLSGGVSATVPLAFIPKGYGAWTCSLSEIYYHTFENDIPGNPSDNFFVTTLSLGVSF